MTFSAPTRRAGGRFRYLLLSVAIIGLLFYLRRSSPTFNSSYEPIEVTPGHLPSIPGQDNPKAPGVIPPGPEKTADAQLPKPEKPLRPSDPAKPSPAEPVVKAKDAHPIETLIKKANKDFDELLKKESKDLKSAAAEYRKKRGRHPPPGFDKWYKYAEDNKAVIVEDFFDQIYHDLAPFWGLAPSLLRKEAHSFEMTLSIRNHTTKASSDWFWTKIWQNMTESIQHILPDMDIAVNAMDEPRIVVPWEEIDRLMEIERTKKTMPAADKVIQEFGSLPKNPDPDVKVRDKAWIGEPPFWKVAAAGCHPDSLARKAEQQTDYSITPQISLKYTTPHTYRGYISNYTLSTDFCHQPDLQGLHGMMIRPLSISSTKTLFPLFGGSKLPTNNEILLPAAMYWNGEERFSGGDDHGAPWNKKMDKVVWRGVATGGLNKADNWRGFQRHRFVAMTNGTQVSLAEDWRQAPQNWALPVSSYNLAASQESRLGKWVDSWADTGFIDLMCVKPQANLSCNYTEPWYSVKKGEPMSKQFNRKYLPDIDGNSFSGRYRGFLLSTSLPIKSTIFREWHDSRLVPWKHFVPMDNRYMDFYGIMEYFLGYEGETIKVMGHDEQAEKIATEGQAWANKVLRKEDMSVYTARLLLEYARLSDDHRDEMGWVGDLR
ncbi:related to capsular associated protein (CAP10) [Rhynchosporium secalis]|uniref:Related to capsular associated protein (CAP10) n=1 Tax=Rhynchosporium secalis TaxID=38038 RepID=A0A1E1MSS7_RHYSE|nr:related to capsular associated protein (CAP10) [Rhynchosporium secalis]